MNNEQKQADELTAFLDAYAAGKTPDAPTLEAEFAADLVDLAASLRYPVEKEHFALDQAFLSGQTMPYAPNSQATEVVTRPRAARSFSLPLVASLVLFFVVGGLLLRSVSLPALAPPVQTVPRLPIPVGGYIHTLDPTMLERMRAAGMEWVAVQVEYDPSAPEAALATARELIDGVKQEDFRVWAVIGSSRNTSLRETDFPAYARFAGEVATFGTDAIQVWETPNLVLVGGAGQLAPASYVDLLRQSYEAIKEANADTLVISAAPAPTSGQASFSGQIINDDVYYQGMAEAGAADYADCIGVNYYEGTVSPLLMEGDLRGNSATRYFLPMIQRAATPFRGFDVPMCLSEYGYLAGEGAVLPPEYDWALGTSREEQAEWLAKGIRIAAELSSVRVAMVMIFRMDAVGNAVEDGYAIVQPDGSCLACDAIAALRQ